MPIDIDAEKQRIKVSCMGDIEVLDFPPDDNGVCWVLLRAREVGEPGRPSNTEIVQPDTDGVLVGMKDPRSARTLRRAFERAVESLQDAGAGTGEEDSNGKD